MNGIFKLPEAIPDMPGKVRMFRSTRFDSMGSRDQKFQAALRRRIKQMMGAFDLKAGGTTEGARMVFRSENHSLQLYMPSDSMWWTDESTAFRETIPEGASLPSPARAEKLAVATLERLQLDVADAKMAGISYVEAAIARGEEAPQTFRTAMDVNYTFCLDQFPVFGPGAKAKVTVIEDARVAQVLYFWRAPSRATQMATLSAQAALDRFMRDPSFFRLRNKDAVVDIHQIRFGYYAMTPTAFQRLYVPVFAIDATVSTREFERYDFRRYVVAVEMSTEQAKAADVVANPAACRVF